MQAIREHYQQIFMIGDNPQSDIKGTFLFYSLYILITKLGFDSYESIHGNISF